MYSRVVTRGLGSRNLVCTRGYGRLHRRIREVIRVVSGFAQQILLRSPWKPTA
jgi:hypothetical protein